MFYYNLLHKNNNNVYECLYFATQNQSNSANNSFFHAPSQSKHWSQPQFPRCYFSRWQGKINCTHNCRI